MAIREAKKLAKGQKLTKKEKEDFRRKKLVEVRKGKGAGRPLQMRAKSAGTFRNPVTQEMLSERREREILRLNERMKEYNMCPDKAKNFGVVQPANCKFGNNQKKGIGE